MFDSPAFAVESEMEGSDKDGALIDDDGLLRRYCCCAAAAARRAACAVCCSLPLGELEKNFVNRVALEKDARRFPVFSIVGVFTPPAVLLANGLAKTPRGIVYTIGVLERSIVLVRFPITELCRRYGQKMN
jgi:hypothetical protein